MPGHWIRHHTEMVDCEGGAEASKPGDYLIEEQGNAVAPADVAQAYEIALGPDQNAGRASNGFDNAGGDGFGAMKGDEPFEIVGFGSCSG